MVPLEPLHSSFKTQNLRSPFPPRLPSAARPAAAIRGLSFGAAPSLQTRGVTPGQPGRQLLASRFPCPSSTGAAPTCILSLPHGSFSPRGLTYSSFFAFCSTLHLGSAGVTRAQPGAWCSFPHTFPSGWPLYAGKTSQ